MIRHAATLVTVLLLAGSQQAQAQFRSHMGDAPRVGDRPVRSGDASAGRGSDYRGTAQSGRGAPSPTRSYLPRGQPQQTTPRPQAVQPQGRTVSLRDLRNGRRRQQITDADRQRMVDEYRRSLREGNGGGEGGGGY